MGISYLQPRTYLPDFLFSGNKKKKQKVIIEVKGFFRVGDVSKYKAIATSCKEQGYRFCMVLSHPDKPVRKGTKLTMAEWCNKNSIEWFDAGMLYLLKRSMK